MESGGMDHLLSNAFAVGVIHQKSPPVSWVGDFVHQPATRVGVFISSRRAADCETPSMLFLR